MRISELAERAGVTPDTVRYYERAGLLSAPDRAPNGYRVYAPEYLEDLRFIKKAQAAGLKLGSVREVMRIAAGGIEPCQQVRISITARLGEVEDRLKELRTLRATLRATLARLDEAPPPTLGCRCAAIESA